MKKKVTLLACIEDDINSTSILPPTHISCLECDTKIIWEREREIERERERKIELGGVGKED